MSRTSTVSWSELHADVLQLILERLNIITYVRARTVCKDWYAVCKQRITSVQENSPWLIIFPAGRPKCGSCLVFDLSTFRLTHICKFYRLHNLGEDFSTHRCIATCGSWLLMLNLRSSLYVLNVFTRERINLPPLESHEGRLLVERRRDTTFIINKSSVTARNAIKKTNAVLWVDEKTKGYIVVWSIGFYYMMYTRSGLGFWREIPTREGPENLHGCQDIAYKDNKLYVLTRQNQIRILDFSQELPLALPNNVEHQPFTNERPWRVKIGVTVSGHVLMVKDRSNMILKILKRDSEVTIWDPVESLEGEAWITDLGVTIPAVNGTKPSSIYYSKDKHVYLGDVSAQMLWKVLNVNLNRNFSYARWFIPSLREI